MDTTLCEKYGYDEAGRRRLLQLLGFDLDDPQHARQLQTEIIGPHCSSIVEHFYDFLLNQPEMTGFFESPERLKHLKQTHADYLHTLGVDFGSENYFNDRLRVGAAHAGIGLPLHLYLAAYRKLEELILKPILEQAETQPGRFMALIGFVLRITKLDICLAIETFHLYQVQDLIRSVDHLVDEKHDLSQKALQDELTQLGNRRFLKQALDNAIHQAQLHGLPLCVALMDLDHFKEVNDQYGHLVGDQVLREVSRRLQAAVREVDTVGRYGGEEFLVILPATDTLVCKFITDRIRERISASPIHVSGNKIKLTASLGFTALVQGDSAEGLIERADQALYKAKKAGRNRVESQ